MDTRKKTQIRNIVTKYKKKNSIDTQSQNLKDDINIKQFNKKQINEESE